MGRINNIFFKKLIISTVRSEAERVINNNPPVHIRGIGPIPCLVCRTGEEGSASSFPRHGRYVGGENTKEIALTY